VTAKATDRRSRARHVFQYRGRELPAVGNCGSGACTQCESFPGRMGRAPRGASKLLQPSHHCAVVQVVRARLRFGVIEATSPGALEARIWVYIPGNCSLTDPELSIILLSVSVRPSWTATSIPYTYKAIVRSAAPSSSKILKAPNPATPSRESHHRSISQARSACCRVSWMKSSRRAYGSRVRAAYVGRSSPGRVRASASPRRLRCCASSASALPSF
jgi:hypothetical protein